MQAAVEKMTAQLKLWSLKIDHLDAKTQKAGARARFENLMYVDELKALYAIAQLKFDEFRTAGDTERAHLKDEMSGAWNELDAAFKNPKPSP
jgi:VIT1/CCC1 family predicted Fe2+/Mn2+ transporter